MHCTTCVTRTTSNRQGSSEEGFTLIELLVVVLIIGILSAIAIPAFLAQREGAMVATVRSDLKNASLAVENFAIENSGGYDGVDSQALATLGFRESEGVDIEVVATGNTYEIVAVSAGFSPARTWTYSSVTGTVTD